MTLAQEIFSEPPKTKAVKDALSLVEALVAAEFIDEDKQKEILEHEDLAPFFTRASKKSSGEKKPRGKKKTTDPSERDGQVDEHKCLARIWAGKGKQSEYDNVQCSVKRVEGLGCFCKQHYAKDLACKKIDDLDGWFLGIVTEKKPEKILVPSKWDKDAQEYMGEIDENHRWSDSVEEKPKKKKKAKKVVKEDTESEEEVEEKQKKKKVVKDLPDWGEEEAEEKSKKKKKVVKEEVEEKKEEKEVEEKPKKVKKVVKDDTESEEEEEVKKKPKKKKVVKEVEEKKDEEEVEDDAETLELPSEDEDEDSEDEDEDEYHEHEGVSYMLVECELVDVVSGKVVGKIEGGEVTLTKHGGKLHKKNRKALGE